MTTPPVFEIRGNALVLRHVLIQGRYYAVTLQRSGPIPQDLKISLDGLLAIQDCATRILSKAPPPGSHVFQHSSDGSCRAVSRSSKQVTDYTDTDVAQQFVHINRILCPRQGIACTAAPQTLLSARLSASAVAAPRRNAAPAPIPSPPPEDVDTESSSDSDSEEELSETDSPRSSTPQPPTAALPRIPPARPAPARMPSAPPPAPLDTQPAPTEDQNDLLAAFNQASKGSYRLLRQEILQNRSEGSLAGMYQGLHALLRNPKANDLDAKAMKEWLARMVAAGEAYYEREGLNPEDTRGMSLEKYRKWLAAHSAVSNLVGKLPSVSIERLVDELAQ